MAAVPTSGAISTMPAPGGTMPFSGTTAGSTLGASNPLSLYSQPPSGMSSISLILNLLMELVSLLTSILGQGTSLDPSASLGLNTPSDLNSPSSDSSSPPSDSSSPPSGSSNPPSGPSNPPSGSSNPPSDPNTGATIANGDGWNKNVAVFASSKADEESWGNDTSGYTFSLAKAMDQGDTLTQAQDSVHLDNQTPIRNNANPNSLVHGGGGTAILVTGDNIDPSGNETKTLADALKRDYGMDVKVISDGSPNQLKAAIQEAGQQTGKQCVVAVLAHGAKDDSGKNEGTMALGKGDGDQWLHEDMLKSWVNQYLSPKYTNTNVIISSCFGGNFVQ